MNIEVGAIITGKVTGIQPFGAFVALDENTQGMVHISEVSNTFVKDINDFLKVGEEVTVKVLNISDDKKKISLSIKATQPKPERAERPQRPRRAPKKAAHTQAQQKVEAEGYNTLAEELKKINLNLN